MFAHIVALLIIAPPLSVIGSTRRLCSALPCALTLVRPDSGAAQCGRSKEGRGQQQTEFRGRYVNEKYGFSVTIPNGLVGKGSVPPAPNHGFEIDFSAEPHDSIGVFSEYDVDNQEPTRHSASSSSRGKRVTVGRATLGGLPAQLTVTTITGSSKPGTALVKKLLSAHRQSAGEKIDYTVILTTREALLPERETIFREMVESFKLLPVR
jgi:hypothetical protein